MIKLLKGLIQQRNVNILALSNLGLLVVRCVLLDNLLQVSWNAVYMLNIAGAREEQGLPLSNYIYNMVKCTSCCGGPRLLDSSYVYFLAKVGKRNHTLTGGMSLEVQLYIAVQYCGTVLHYSLAWFSFQVTSKKIPFQNSFQNLRTFVARHATNQLLMTSTNYQLIQILVRNYQPIVFCIS